jgi:beta-lactamase regulating signal transducer with metallopeptidase domain
MSAVSEFAGAWWDWAFAASWQIALLVCVIAALTYLLRDASPRLRHGLWLLVLVKALLPPTLSTFWGVGAWGVVPVADLDWPIAAVDADAGIGAAAPPTTDRDAVAPGDGATVTFSTKSWLFGVWAAGCSMLWLTVAWRYWRVTQQTSAMRRVDEGPARVELERLADRFSVRVVPDLYATDRATSPMLVGVLRPKIVLPESILERLSAKETRMVLAHELVHWRRHDTWLGWLQVFVQGVFWFHPLVWWANARIRHERECACDEAVLREASCDRDGYGETLLRVLTASRGRSMAMANMVGVFERGSQLQIRLEEIMSFDPKKRRFGWVSRAALAAAALVLLPMAAPRVEADGADHALTTAATGETPAAGAGEAPSNRPRTNWPTIVSTKPEIGATDVDPGLKEISVTFDRDMDVGGYSWTGGGEYFPPSPPETTPVWVDKRTCVLPVELKRGSFYRVGINSTSFHNFRSDLGVPAATAAIYFATKGANRAVANRIRVPKVTKLSPENGATDVDPGVKMLRVTFDMPMGTDGYSFTGGGPTYPGTPGGEQPRWSRDGKTCMLPVKLAPGTHYELGLNSVSHKNFTSKWGVPLEPVQYTFQTSGEKPQEPAAADATASDPSEPPRIVKMVPENGAANVDPAINEIQVTFDRPMAAGFSWTGGGEQFPTIPEGQKPRWSADRKLCTLPVSLQPNWQYRFGLNSRSFKNFASAVGVPLEPVVYEFRTSPGSQ